VLVTALLACFLFRAPYHLPRSKKPKWATAREQKIARQDSKITASHQENEESKIRMTPKERYLKALADPASGITLDTQAHLIEGTIQQRWGQAAQRGSERANKLTGAEALAQARLNSGYTVTAIRELPKPGMGGHRGIKVESEK
jgi:hypothetical protein